MNEVVAAYLGAVLDTDGCVGYTKWMAKDGLRKYPRMSVTNQNIEILSVFLRALKVGTVSLQGIGVNAPIFQWQFGNKKVVPILRELRAYSTKAQSFLAEYDAMSYTDREL